MGFFDFYKETSFMDRLKGYAVSGLARDGSGKARARAYAEKRKEKERRKNAALYGTYHQVALAIYERYRTHQQQLEANSRYRPDGTRGRNEWVEGNNLISVTNGFSRDYNCYTTDILIAPRDGSGDRYHIVFNEDGSELLNELHRK